MERKSTTLNLVWMWQWPQELDTSVHSPGVHCPLSLWSPKWRYVSASFRTKNFKWISYITPSLHATMSRSITLSAGTKPPGRHTHTHTHCNICLITSTQEITVPSRCLIWIRQRATNPVSTLNKLAFLLSGVVNHKRSWPGFAYKKYILHCMLFRQWAKNTTKHFYIHHMSHIMLFSKLGVKANFFFLSLKCQQECC